tara:strand:+ start:7235 stop:8311 length:1077 start_codon:yes stop_codon:yes gene_type:complete
MDQRLLHKVVKRLEEGTLRSLSHFEGFIDFFSNDYLGLSKVKVENENHSQASTGSRLISGTSSTILLAEKELTIFFNSQSALFFNSGYDANLGFFSSVPQRGDTIIYDEFIHASVRDGIRLSFANHFAFSHNDIDDLRKKITSAKGTIYVAIEALYSMDGDLGPIQQIQELCTENNAYLIVDEAHSSGVYGEGGRGLVSMLKLEGKIFARLVTFGKAYGSHGAVILGSEKLIQYLTNFARSFIYTTALPDATINRNVKIAQRNDINERRSQLQSNIDYFRANCKNEGLISEVNSPIQIVEIGTISETKRTAKCLQENKLAVKPIFSPTVAKGKERLRLCFHSFNTKEEISRLIELLNI